MDIKITKPMQGGVVRAIASKSEAHRLLICAALADGEETYIECTSRSEDIDATSRCLAAIGATVRDEPDGFCVAPADLSDMAAHYHLDCSESGSTLRFLLPVCGALGLPASIHMSGRLPARPLSALYDEMVSHGCRLSEQGRSPLTCEGQLQSGAYTLPGNVSSQYVSGLLFALPLLAGDSVINVSGGLESRPYADMTLDALRLFGIVVAEKPTQVFRIPGGQRYRSPKTVRVGGDWSNAAFWLCAGAVGHNAVVCTGLDPQSRQGDKAVVELLQRFGAAVVLVQDACTGMVSVTVNPRKLAGIAIDAADVPDLVPVLAAVASVAEGTTRIYNAGRLRIKESDRLQTVSAALSCLGADITETEDGLVINGKKSLSGGVVNAGGDHRIAMTAAVASAVSSGPVVIRGAEAVNKSYPNFFADFQTALGGMCVEV